MSFGHAAVLAYVKQANHLSHHQRLFCCSDDIHCLFLGSLSNLCTLNRQTKGPNEAILTSKLIALFVIEDIQLIKLSRILMEALLLSSMTAKLALSLLLWAVKLYWGIAADGSAVISDDLEIIKVGCAKSFAPFPTGFMFHSEGGLMSFEHPMNKVRAMPRTDSEETLCGANFKVDVYTRINSLPRRGSEANWTEWDPYT